MRPYLLFVASVLMGIVLAGVRPGVAASFSYSGECFPDQVAALEKFSGSFPLYTGGAMLTLIASSITDTGILSYSIQSDSLIGASSVGSSSTMQLTTCTPGLVANSNQHTMLVIIACVFACFFGFRIGASMTNRGGVV
jgi:hypothetical protein